MVSLLTQSVHLDTVPREAAGRREGHATGGAGVGAVAGMGAHVFRQVARPRASFTADRALKDGLAPRPASPLLDRPCNNSARSFARIFSLPLASDHREINLHSLRLAQKRYWSKQTKYENTFIFI